MVLTFGNWFELEVIPGVLSLFRVGLLAICFGMSHCPKTHFDLFKMDGCWYLQGFGREVMVSTKG